MKPVVYIETSVISYLASRPSRDVIVAARQAISQDWWENQSQRFDLRISALVEEEISYGDAIAAERRASLIVEIVEAFGYVCPQLCSPEELGGQADD